MSALIAALRLRRPLAALVLGCFLAVLAGGVFKTVASPAAGQAEIAATRSDDGAQATALTVRSGKRACCSDLTCEPMLFAAWCDMPGAVYAERRRAEPALLRAGTRIPPQLGPPRRRIV